MDSGRKTRVQQQEQPLAFFLSCEGCMKPFSGSECYPRILPCGDSFCAKCINNWITQNEHFSCLKCDCLHASDFVAEHQIPNNLYFEMIQEFKQFFKKSDFLSSKAHKDLKNQRKTYALKDKCLYTFCREARYKYDNVEELFCSKKCQQNNEKLYS